MTRVAVLLAVGALAAGSTHVCGLASGGAAYCWGDDRYGQLGDGRSGDGVVSTTPVAVPLPK
jgi:alpha-tubulin suppressor-like RCC1 family protein